MDALKEIENLSAHNDVVDGIKLPKVELNKWLMFGQSAYVCRYGTLSDGHEKLTPAQRYAQAIKEQYTYSLAIRNERVKAMRYQANLMEAKERLKAADTDAAKLRAQADIEEAETGLMDALLQIQDRLRCVKEFAKVRMELKDAVEAKYKDFESSEQDNWTTVALYRLEKGKTPGIGAQQLDNVPLSPERKALLGYTFSRMDAIAPLLVVDKKKCLEIGASVKPVAIAAPKKESTA